MRESILHWIKLHEEEIAIFLWTAALLFLVRSSGMILNNYAETAFLKRYGIEYLPIVNMINTVATFFITGILATFMAKISGVRLLFHLFIFCGVSVAIIRLSIPMGLALIYPLLFMLKSQFELLQALLFWNLANDIFNTRQSKRIFPLLTAGGVVGLIAGSFGTPSLARIFQFDNLLFVYLATTIAGAAVVKGMGRQFPALLRDEKKGTQPGGRASMADEIKRVWPLLRQSSLFKIVLVLTFMPNVVIPIMNYQFNFAVDQFFPTESGMLAFFSYFRGVLNIISLFILLFVGRIYGYFGLPLALMLHPLNYAVAFLAFFLRFDLFSAIYARMSTNVIRTTINMPANSILIGLFPESYRGMVRPFLRGTVVRAGLLLGSALILVVVTYLHPRYLSLVALPFVLAWMAAPMILKRNYASILKNLIAGNLLDLRSLEAENAGALFRKEGAGEELATAFLSAKGEDAIWYARLLKSLDVKNLDALIFKAMENQNEATRIKLIEMLPDKPGPETIGVLAGLLEKNRDQLNVAILKTVMRAGVKGINPKGLPERIGSFINDPNPEVRGYAAGCLCLHDPGAICDQIDAWLASADFNERQSGVIAAGQTGKKDYYTETLENMLDRAENEGLYADILHALAALGSSNLNRLATGLLDHNEAEIRRAALSVIKITDDEMLKKIINHLGDPEASIRHMATEKIKKADHINGRILIESLARPNRHLRKNLFHLLETFEIKDLDLYRFTTEGLRECYICLAKAEALENVPESKVQKLLFDHMLEKKDLILENIFRILSLHDQDSRMRTVRRGIFSKDTRVQGNSIELLGNILDRKRFGMFQPLIEGFSLHRSVVSGKKFFRLPRLIPIETHLFPAFLNSEDMVETAMALSMLQSMADAGERLSVDGQKAIIAALCESSVSSVREAACKLYDTNHGVAAKEQKMTTTLPIPDKILLLRKISIFSDLTVSELGAIATVAEEVEYPEGKTVIREGEPGENVFLIISGEVTVYKQGETKKEIMLDTMTKGDYFGEMALFEKRERSATIHTTRPSRFLVLHKQEFNELVREYPRIALQICTALSHRLRNLQSRLTQVEQCPPRGKTDPKG